ncbi:flagellar hook assembly protein FlgD [Pusillimonas sp. CC-YST705]|uniref:Basal-body rod modification protein FlgD n=1 Tax=Mesopusillimonas faecipullorum TaxID=2755040 RepID=A0ABS8C9V7_9BURK|nr:flagellar hook capping FlgD N-terminal domain-containing protein [Mesopusillimonas faecipullorum]MCB5362815.1 flagellar hook assembly protein FlgD [Mesopusillimonas faecipullorum]
MSTINATSSNTAAAALAQASQSSSLMGDTQDRFLTLLVTQLRNQDPLNPMDNAAVTSQIAQLSTVSGIEQLNNTLLALSGQMDLSQSMQAASFIGKEVLVPGDKIRLGSSADGQGKVATPFGFELYSDAKSVQVSILDGSGQVMRLLELEAHTAGIYSLEWDGLNDKGQAVSDGAYQVSVRASDADGNALASEALTYGKVGSVAYSSAGLRLDLGLAGTYSLFDVRKVM